MDPITTADNTKLYVKDWGAGKPVILLSGWPLSADSWDDQALVIAGSGYRTIAYDRPTTRVVRSRLRSRRISMEKKEW